jgi:hypothetical protein
MVFLWSLINELSELGVKPMNLEDTEDAAVGGGNALGREVDVIGRGGDFIESSDIAPIGNDVDTSWCIGIRRADDNIGVNAGNDEEIAAANCEVSSGWWLGWW